MNTKVFLSSHNIFTKIEQHKGPICCQYAKEIYFHGDKNLYLVIVSFSCHNQLFGL